MKEIIQVSPIRKTTQCATMCGHSLKRCNEHEYDAQQLDDFGQTCDASLNSNRLALVNAA